MIGQVYQTVSTLVQPPAKDTIEILTKLIRQRPSDFKVHGFDTIAKVLRTGHATYHSDQLLKTLLKMNVGSEFQIEWIECLAAIVDEYPQTYVQWHSVWPELMQISFKEMEIRCSNKLLSSLMRGRLNEAKQQGNITTSFKQFNATLKGDGKKKTTQQILDVPRTLYDVFTFLTAVIIKLITTGELSKASQNVCQQIFQFISQISQELPQHLESVAVDHMLGCFLLVITETPHPYYQAINLALANIVDTMESCNSYLEQLYKLVLQTLKTKKYKLRNDCVQDLQTHTQKQIKGEIIVNKQIQTCLLQTLNHMVEKFELDYMVSLQGSCNNFVDILLPYFSIKETAIFACEVIKSTGLRNPSWLHQLTSVIISCVQIQCADIMSQPPGYVFTGNKQLSTQFNTLSMLSTALACCLKSFSEVIGGEPIQIAGIALQVAKSLILSNSGCQDISSFTFKSHYHRLQGYIILEGLIGLGSSWVQQNIEEVINLIQVSFSKGMCQVDFQRLSEDAMYLEFFVQEYKAKEKALNCISSLLDAPDKQQLKLIGSFLGNSTAYLLSKDQKLLWNAMSWQEVTLVNKKLFSCLVKIPPQYYKSKLVVLLHSLCDSITSENVAIPKACLDPQDNNLTSHKKPEDSFSQITSEFDQVQILDRETSLLRQPFDMQAEKKGLVEQAINLFGFIYSSGCITQSNQEQLIKHFLAHTQPPVKKNQKEPQASYRPEKILKMARIGATFLSMLKKTPQIIPSTQVHQLIKNLTLAQDDTLARLIGELEVECNSQLLLQDGPDLFIDTIEESLAQNLHTNQVQALAKVAVFCGLLVRNFDDLVWTASTPRITNVFLKLLQSPNQTVVEYAFHYAASIAKESESFTTQILPSLFAKYYSLPTDQNQESIRNFVARCLKIASQNDNNLQSILFKDTFSNQEGQATLIQEGLFSHLLQNVAPPDVELVHRMIIAGQQSRLNSDENDFIYQALNQMTEFQTENSREHAQLAKQNYQEIANAHIQRRGVRAHLDFVKQCLSYTHLSALALFNQEPSSRQKNLFARAIRSDSLAFVVQSLTDSLSQLSVQTSELVLLLNFSLSVSSNQFQCIRLAGVKLLSVILRRLAHTIEQVGDVDEDLSPRTREEQAYLNSPLLLEQFEAQIFSIIRQVLSSQTGSESQPEVLKIVLQIVFDFITFPITKDPSLIKRIVDLLSADFNLNLFDGDIFTHEGLITELHYQKLGCLAQLYLMSVKGNSALIQGPKASKFDESDRQNLAQAFTARLTSLLVQHWQTAVQDLVNLQTSQGASMLKKNHFMIGGSFDLKVLQKQVPAMIEAVLLADSSDAVSLTVNSYVLKSLSQEFGGDIYDFYNQKVTGLLQLQLCVGKFTKIQLSELLLLMQDLTALGISEITQLVVAMYSLLIKRHLIDETQTATLLWQAAAILKQADPDLHTSSQLVMYSQAQSTDMHVIKESLLCVENCIEALSLIGSQNEQLNSFVTQIISQIWRQLSMGTLKNQQIYQEILVRILAKLAKTDLAYFSSQAIDDLKQMVAQTSLATNHSQHLFISLLQLVKSSLPELSETVQCLTQLGLNLVQSIPPKAFTQIVAILAQNPKAVSKDILQAIGQRIVEECLDDITFSQKGGLSLLFKLYAVLDTPQRAVWLVPYFALLLQAMQSKQLLDDATRNQAAEHLALLVRVDLTAFQQFATSKDAQGQQMLSGVEKTVAENVIRNYALQNPNKF